MITAIGGDAGIPGAGCTVPIEAGTTMMVDIPGIDIVAGEAMADSGDTVPILAGL